MAFTPHGMFYLSQEDLQPSMDAIGTGFRGMLGVQNKEEAVNAILEGADYDTPEGRRTALEKIRAIDPEAYYKYSKMNKEYETKAKPSAFAEKIAFINGMDISDAEKAEMRKKVAGGSGTTINMGAGDTAYDKEAGKIAAKTDKDLVELATITATASLDKTGEVLDILETGEASTGMFAGLDLVKNRFLSVFGNEEARKSATKTQVLEAFLGSDVFPMIKALGIGARGLDTPAEREFLINVMTGAKEMNKEAIIKLTELRRGINESVVEKYNKRLADGGLDRFQKAYGRPLEPIKLKFRPPSSAISGVINGTKVFKLTNGEYVDAYGKPFKLNKGK